MPGDFEASSESTASDDVAFSSSGPRQQYEEEKHKGLQVRVYDPRPTPPPTAKRKRNLPGMPDPDSEVIALSPRTLMTTNRFLCEVCGKGFQRDQNLQLHRRGHNLPWKLKRAGGGGAEQARRKRVYVCPVESCVHHHPSRALGDLTGVKKHYSRKHGEKKWRCDRCGKKYAVVSDWKAHGKTCGTREYRCDCGTTFTRRDSFITHRAFCDVLAGELTKASPAPADSATTEEVAATSLASSEFSPPPMLTPPLRSPSVEAIRQLPVPEEKKELDATENTTSIQYRIPKPVDGVPRSSVDNLHYHQCSGGSSIGSDETATATRAGGMFSAIFSHPAAIHNPAPYQGFAELTPAADPPPPFLGLSAAAGLNFLASAPPQQQSLSPHMSATALLQKAAQMGAAASNASLLRGFGLAPSSSSSAPPDPAARLGLGLLPYDGGFAELVMGGGAGQSSSLCGSRPSATLDFLGLGMAGAGAGGGSGGGGGRFTALFNSITGASALDLGPAGPFGSEMKPD